MPSSRRLMVRQTQGDILFVVVRFDLCYCGSQTVCRFDPLLLLRLKSA